MSKPNIKFEEEFFKGEFREGFFVEEEMKRCWAAQMEVMYEIDKICKKYNLRWFADSGTLLGAVRHKGFIPWDDDTDIVMLREEYNQFIKVAVEELPEGYVVASPYTEHHTGQSFARVVNSLKISYDKDRMEAFHGSPYCSGVDIFPLDFLPRDEDERKMQKDLCEILRVAAKECTEKENYEDILGQIEELCKVKINREEDVQRQLLVLIDTLASVYGENEGDDVAPIAFYLSDEKVRFPKQAYEKTVMLPFENMMVPAPAGFRDVLKGWYGADYMTPVRNTSTHEYPYYKKQRRGIEDALDEAELNQVREKISKILNIKLEEINDLKWEKKSWLNHTFSFLADGIKTVVRFTREGSERLIDRKKEAEVYQELTGYPDSEKILFISPVNGIKMSVYQEHEGICRKDNWEDVRICVEELKRLHTSDRSVPYELNIMKNICDYEKLWCGEKSCYDDYENTFSLISEIDDDLKKKKEKVVLAHMDASADNFLIYGKDEKKAFLIDYEYAAMAEPIADLAKFAIEGEYQKEELEKLLHIYDETYGENELQKLYGYMAELSLMESNWAEYQFRMGEPLGEQSIHNYEKAKEYAQIWKEMRVCRD